MVLKSTELHHFSKFKMSWNQELSKFIFILRNRTVAATQMNATSSRAHTIITVEFKQIQKVGEAKS